MAENGQARQYGYAERLIQTRKGEEVDLSDDEDYNGAIWHPGRFLKDVYMHKRSHSSLGYVAPTGLEERRVSANSLLMFTRPAPRASNLMASAQPTSGQAPRDHSMSAASSLL